ncbi:MAG: hypothetical protein KDD61_03865 [Bdellovibrionales bacterium]|nr:hypothetical protein [Bdellovibrionales bacterium]
MGTLKKVNYYSSYALSIIDFEYQAFLEYQRAIKQNSDLKEIDIIFPIRQKRKEAFEQLLERFPNVSFNKGSINDVIRIVDIDNASSVLNEYFLRLEKNHQVKLNQVLREFYCPLDVKETIESQLLPLSKEIEDSLSAPE